MAYDPTLPDSQNRVRFLIPDRGTTQQISDAEIDAVLAQHSSYASTVAEHLTAAKCLELIFTEYASRGQGVGRKKVSKLEIEYGSRDGNVEAAVQARIDNLRTEAARLSRSKPAFSTVREPPDASASPQVIDRQ